MKTTRELSFLKTLPSAQPKQLLLSFPNGCTWDNGSFNSYPMPHSQLKLEWINFLKQISLTKSTDTLTLFLDCNYMDIKHIEDLLKVIQKTNCNVKEVAMHNIDALLPYSSDPSLSTISTKSDLSSSVLFGSELSKSVLSKSVLSKSVLSKSVLSKSAIQSNFIFTELLQDEQAALAKHLPCLLKGASKVNLSCLPLGSSTCDFMFSILNNLKCSELEISANHALDITILPDYLNFFISQNKHITKLDISKICQVGVSMDSFAEAIVLGCSENTRIEVKYSNAPYAKDSVPPFLKWYLELSEIRMDSIKNDFIKSLLEVAYKLAKVNNFPKEIIAHIIGDYVDPYTYMKNTSMFQPDGMHITALLGEEHNSDIISDF